VRSAEERAVAPRDLIGCASQGSRVSTHQFATSVRVLLCVSCGAPLEVALAAETSGCGYCGAQNALGLRDDSPLVAGPAVAPVDDAQRTQRLRLQADRPLLPPPALQALVPGGRIEAWKVQEVFAVWQSTREEARTTRSYDAAERLQYLTMVLANHYSEQKDALRQRAMFESALAVVTLPRHRQMLRGYLSRAATRDGDLEAAEAWLAPCDTRSDDLDTDTAWRISRAYLETGRAAWPAVLALLGSGPDDVPIADFSVPLAVMLRANAWEQQGDPGRAVDLLRKAMAKGVSMRRALETISRLHPDPKLCPTAFPRAEAAYTVAAAKAAGSGSGLVGGIFYWSGVAMLAVSALCLVLMVLFGAGALIGAIPAVVRLPNAVSATLVTIAGISGTVAFTCAMILPTTLPMGGIFAGVGYAFRKAGKRAERLRLHGIRGTADVLAIKPTGMTINDVPQMALTLRIRIPDADPYEASTSMLLGPGSPITPGVTVPVRVDPEDRKQVILETD
jgi:hypothetical protein